MGWCEEGTNQFNWIKLHWTVHPDRTEDWRTEQDKLLRLDMLFQECDCDFITSGRTVIDGVILEECRNNMVNEPSEKRGLDGNLWVWKYPNYDKQYILSMTFQEGTEQTFLHFMFLMQKQLNKLKSIKGKFLLVILETYV